MTANAGDEFQQDETPGPTPKPEFVEQETPAPGLPDAWEEYGLPTIEWLVEDEAPAPGLLDPCDEYGLPALGSDRPSTQPDGGDPGQASRP
jgi:hypothetical protein